MTNRMKSKLDNKQTSFYLNNIQNLKNMSNLKDIEQQYINDFQQEWKKNHFNIEEDRK